MKTLEITTQKEYENNIDFDGIFIIKNSVEWIKLRENSTAELRENSTAVLRENSTAELWENSRAVLWENSTAALWENSRAVLWENSTAELRENSTADGLDNSSLLFYNDNKIKLFGNASAKKYIQPVYDKSVIDFISEKEDNKIILYKCVNPKNNTDFHTGKIKYEIGKKTICPDWDNDVNRECGGGLHLCFTALGTKRFNNGKILKCLVNKKDIVVYKNNVDKVRCKAVLPIAEVNLHGDIINAEKTK